MTTGDDREILALLDRARATPFIQSAIAALGSAIDPPPALAALERARHELDERVVTVLLCALAAAGKLPASRQFVPALALVADMGQFVGLLAASPDDPSEALLDLFEGGTLSRQRECVALLFVAERLRAAGSGTPTDARVCRLLRQQMRKGGSVDEAMVLTMAVERLGDPGVAEVAKELGMPKPVPQFGQRLIGMLRLGWRDFVPEREPPRVQVGTVRRQAAKVQRNDPCPCGSGRKFKKCCAGKGEVVEAVVVETPRQAEDYWAMRPAEIARLDPQRLDRIGLVTCFRVALHYHHWELAERFMAALADHLQDPEEADGFREELCREAAEASATEVVDRNVARARDPQQFAASIGVGARLMRPDAGTLEGLEQQAAAGLRGDSDAFYDLAYGLLDHLPALGILVARGVLDPRRDIDSWALVEEIERARDRLLLPPGDVAASMYELMAGEHVAAEAQRSEGKAVEKLATTLALQQHELERAQREAAALQQRMTEATGRIAVLEQAAAKRPDVAAAASSAVTSEEAAELRHELVRLRGRVTELKGLVNENLERRKELERQLEAREGEVGGAPSGVVASPGGAAGREEGGEAEVVDEALAPRVVSVPVWAEAAVDALHRLERGVAARIVRAVGLVAAADAGAWRDVKALRSAPGVLRLRVGQWRVLFREDVGRRVLTVVEVVVRGELEGVVKRLR